MDNPRNQDGIGAQELLVVSFGTSYNNNREKTVGAIEEAMEKAFPEYSIRRSFNSKVIIRIIAKRDGVQIDNVQQALERAAANGVKKLIVQPSHLMDGIENNDLTATLESFKDSFETVAVGKPILSEDEDFRKIIAAISAATKQYDDGETAICFMGHGTEASVNSVYTKLQGMLQAAGFRNYFIGTVEAAPTLEDVLSDVKKGSYKKVVLQPLMIVAGDHANNDMAGNDEDSWKSVFTAAGYEVTCVLRGLGEFPAIHQILVEHAQAAMDSVK